MTAITNAFMGTMLWVDLTTGSIERTPLEEDEILTRVGARVAGASRGDDETLVIEARPEGEEKALADGRLLVKDLSEQRLLVVADALAKSVALARDERRVNADRKSTRLNSSHRT